MIYRSRICGKKREGLEGTNLRSSSKWGREGVHVEHERDPESLAINQHPFIPRDGLTPFEDVFDVPIEPVLRGRSRKFPERRFCTADPQSDDGEHEEEERCCKKPQEK